MTEEKLQRVGVLLTRDFLPFPESRLIELFGKMGVYFYRIARGIDERSVRPSRERKSVGAEDTFAQDLIELPLLVDELSRLAEKVWSRLGDKRGRTVSVKVTYHDFAKATRARTLSRPLSSVCELQELACHLLHQTEAGNRPIRLVGVTVSGFTECLRMHPDNMSGRQKQLTFPFFS